MSSSTINEKLVQYFNEALAIENAAVDRIKSRIEDTPVEENKQQLQYHLEQTFQQQDRLRNIITGLGGNPATIKATLPKLMPLNNTAKEATSSNEGSEGKDRVDAEKEITLLKEDAMIENAEIVSYKTLILMAQEVGRQDIVPALNESLKEETAMVNFILGNTPVVLKLLMPQLQGGSRGGGSTMMAGKDTSKERGVAQTV